MLALFSGLLFMKGMRATPRQAQRWDAEVAQSKYVEFGIGRIQISEANHGIAVSFNGSTKGATSRGTEQTTGFRVNSPALYNFLARSGDKSCNHYEQALKKY